MNIFEIQQSKHDKELVMKNGSWEFEVVEVEEEWRMV